MEFIASIDIPALLTLLLSVLCCSVLGSFLLLRKESMLSDSLSHAVLPGLAFAFIVSGTIEPVYMMLGAFASCLICVGLISLIQKFVKLDDGSAMGLVFTSLFALGLFLLEHEIGSKIHLDAHHALYGALELIYWDDLTFSTLPSGIAYLGLMSVLVLAFTFLFLRKLKMFVFDIDYARFAGHRVFLYDMAFFLLISATIVLSFNAVGSILVIALFVAPAAVARLFAQNLPSQILIAVLVGFFCVVLGYGLASWAPPLLGFAHSLSAGGMIAGICGIVLLFAVYWRSIRVA